MTRIVIAVGSNRKPKLDAVREALNEVSELLAPAGAIEIVPLEVESGVGHTPASQKELMRGARQRAEAVQAVARERNAEWSYFVGLEGGLDVIVENSHRRVFLESWAYISNGAEGYFGRSGAVELPDALAEEVLTRGRELSAAIDDFAQQTGIRDAQGAWGVLTANKITRQEAFRVAVTAAFAPFFNRTMYRKAGVSSRF